MIAGAIVTFFGARDLMESYLGQSMASRNFRATATAPSKPSREARPHLHYGDTVARLSIPRLNTELYVVEGDDERDLRRGPGHMTGTAMPGTTGNAVIAGHRDTHFRVLKDIRKGDDIVVQTHNGQFVYRVQRTSIVRPSDIRSLRPSQSPVLHLITCYPFYYVGAAPKRFVVEATLTGGAGG